MNPQLPQRATSVRVRSSRARARSWWHLDAWGFAVGALFAALAMTPSLLPRTWLFQGVVAGLTAAIGYGVGTLLRWWLARTHWWRRLSGWSGEHLPRWAPRIAWIVLILVVLGVLAWALVAGAGWQRDIDALVGQERTPTALWLLAGPVLLVVAAGLLAVARVLRKLSQALDRSLQRLHLPRQLARVTAAVVVGLLVVTLLNDGLLQKALTGADQAFALSNDGDKDGVRRPRTVERSGSEASLIPWESLGREGRAFVAGGRDAAELASVTDEAAREPVRVFAGLESADTAQGQVDLALAELDRTDAFDRAVLVVATTTGSGWLDEAAVDSLEMMYAGRHRVRRDPVLLPPELAVLRRRPQSR